MNYCELGLTLQNPLICDACDLHCCRFVTHIPGAYMYLALTTLHYLSPHSLLYIYITSVLYITFFYLYIFCITFFLYIFFLHILFLYFLHFLYISTCPSSFNPLSLTHSRTPPLSLRETHPVLWPCSHSSSLWCLLSCTPALGQRQR